MDMIAKTIKGDQGFLNKIQEEIAYIERVVEEKVFGIQHGGNATTDDSCCTGCVIV